MVLKPSFGYLGSAKQGAFRNKRLGLLRNLAQPVAERTQGQPQSGTAVTQASALREMLAG